MIKHCDMCRRTHPRATFYKNRTKRDGLASTCKDCARKLLAKHQRTETYRRNVYEKTVRYRLAHPDRYKAYASVNNGKRDGKVKGSDTCEHCGARGRTEGAHTDYSKPLDVIWLCKTCHCAFDRGLQRH